MSRKPDYTLGAMNKTTDEKNHSAGGAWLNENGTISITLDPFITLTASKSLVLTLFPRDKPLQP